MPSEYEIEEPNKGIKKAAILSIGLVVVLLLVLAIYYLTKVNQSLTDESHPVAFTVKQGLSSRQIAQELREKKIISNEIVFIVYASLNQAANKIQAGDYLLNSNMNIAQIVDVLTRGKVASSGRQLTIIEGWTNKQIGKYLADRQIVKSNTEFEQILQSTNFDFKFKDVAREFSAKGGSAFGGNYQGFLFPDTYKLSKDGRAVELVEKMLANFELKIDDQMLADIKSQNRQIGEILTMASIIEREVGRNKDNLTTEDIKQMQKERELVASVFYNRLEIGMALESDATVNYVTGKSDRQPLIADTKVKSPYNTYQNKGLPPTPIGNPGLNAIKAAIYPANSDFLYFINKPDGEAVFAKTLAEHNMNKTKYLK